MLVIAFFIILNYNVFVKSGVLSDGNRDFNKLLKYTLLINNFTIISTMFGLIVAIYIGCGLIGDDISSGKLYIMIISFPNRWKYLLGNLIGLLLVIFSFVLLILLNYFVSTTVLNVTVNYSDLLLCFLYIFTNMLVITTITAIASIFIKGKVSLVVGLIEMAIFEIYTFQKIPFLDYALNLDIDFRRTLACVAPIINVSPPSIYSDGSLSRYMVTPLILDNMVVYQIIFVIIIIIIGNAYFKHKDL